MPKAAQSSPPNVVATASKRVLRAVTLARDIETMIRSSKWTDGQALPSLRQMSALFHVSHETARRAIGLLEERGLVESIQGRGTVVMTGNERQTARASANHLDSPSRLHAPASRTLTVASCECTPDKQRFWIRALRAFRQLRPDVAVKLIPLARGVEGGIGAGADILHAPAGVLQAMGHQGRLLNLSAAVRDETEWRNDAVDGVAGLLTRDPCWAIPLAFDVEMVCINRRLAGAARLAAWAGGYDLLDLVHWAAQTAGSHRARPLDLPRPHLLLGAYGMDLMKPLKGASVRRTFLTACDRLREGNALYPFYPDGDCPRDPAQQALRRFVEQSAAVVFQHTFMLPRLLQSVRFEWSVLSFPLPPGAPTPCWMLGAGIERHCLFPEEAFALLRFLAWEEGGRIFARAKSNMPPYRSLLRSPSFLEAPPDGMAGILSAAARVAPWDRHGPALVHVVFRIMDEEMMLFLEGRQDARETFDRLAARQAAVMAMHADSG